MDAVGSSLDGFPEAVESENWEVELQQNWNGACATHSFHK
jgi:hypothetical protein